MTKSKSTFCWLHTDYNSTDHERKRTGVNVGVVNAAVVFIGVVPVCGTFVLEAESFGLGGIAVGESETCNRCYMKPTFHSL